MQKLKTVVPTNCTQVQYLSKSILFLSTIERDRQSLQPLYNLYL